MIAQINMRKGTSAEWAAAAPVILLAGESGYDTTLKRYKVGDGETEWANLEWNTLWSRPVGSIYESTVSASPAELFGGTWSGFGAGRVLVGIDSTQTEFDTVEKTGGEKTHTLTIDEFPNHDHDIKAATGGSDPWGIGAPLNSGTAVFLDAYTESVGGDQPHNNLQPYITVYRWVRTA